VLSRFVAGVTFAFFFLSLSLSGLPFLVLLDCDLKFAPNRPLCAIHSLEYAQPTACANQHRIVVWLVVTI